MNKDMTECPKCGNIQPIGTEKCYKCGFRIGSFVNYMESVDNEINRPSRNKMYEISPQWQQYVDKQRSKPKGRFKRLISDPRFVIGFLIIAISLGSFIKYAIDSGMFDGDKNNNNTNQIVGSSKNNTSSKSSNTSSKTSNTSSKSSNSASTSSNKTVQSSKQSNSSSLTTEERKASEDARAYLDLLTLSKKELITMLTMYDGYSKDVATKAVDSLNIDWKEQAARSAKSYMETLNATRDTILYYLKLEGYTDEQAEYGADSIDYSKYKPDLIGHVGDSINNAGFVLYYIASSYDENDARRSLNGVQEGYDVIRIDLFVENQTDYAQSFSDLHFRCNADNYTCTQLLLGTGTFSYSVQPGRWAKGSVFFAVPSDSKNIEVEYAPTLYRNAEAILVFEGNIDSGLNYEDKILLNKSPAKIGEIVQNDNLKITYISSDVCDTTNDWFLSDDMKAIYIEVEIENLSGSNISVGDDFFECYADGEYCSRSLIDDSLPYIVQPGKKVKGKTAFKVPKEAEEIIIKYEYEPCNYIQFKYE